MKLQILYPFWIISVLLIFLLVHDQVTQIKANTFEFKTYSASVTTFITKLEITDINILQKYRMFQCEESYQGHWKCETPVHSQRLNSSLLTYSKLYTYDCYKEFNFRNNGFTVNISKVYVKSAASFNNQIMADVSNNEYQLLDRSITLFGNDYTIMISIMWTNTPISIQSPNPSEIQFNFNGKADRDITTHNIGDIETVCFDVQIWV